MWSLSPPLLPPSPSHHSSSFPDFIETFPLLDFGRLLRNRPFFVFPICLRSSDCRASPRLRRPKDTTTHTPIDTPYLEQTLPRFQLPIPPPSQPSRRSRALTPNSADLSLLFLQNTGRLLSLTLPQRNNPIDPTDRPNFSAVVLRIAFFCNSARQQTFSVLHILSGQQNLARRVPSSAAGHSTHHPRGVSTTSRGLNRSPGLSA